MAIKEGVGIKEVQHKSYPGRMVAQRTFDSCLLYMPVRTYMSCYCRKKGWLSRRLWALKKCNLAGCCCRMLPHRNLTTVCCTCQKELLCCATAGRGASYPSGSEHQRSCTPAGCCCRMVPERKLTSTCHSKLTCYVAAGRRGGYQGGSGHPRSATRQAAVAGWHHRGV